MSDTSRVTAALADGRELIYYYDDASRAVPPPPDLRPLPPRSDLIELRRDPLRGEWVSMTAQRNDRTFLPDAAECPLCPSRNGRLSEIPASDYDVVAFENRFPSFAAPPPDEPEPGPVDGQPLFARRPGAGRCEVVAFSSDHDASFAGLPTRRVQTIIEAWVDRTTALSAQPGVQQVYCFENRGAEIGVTLHHPHGQIYAYPLLPPRTAQVLDACREHRERTGGDLFADVLEAEVTAGTRVVLAGEHWTAFVPAAARWPFELHLYPHRQVSGFPELTEAERDELAELYPRLLRACDDYYGTPLPYVAGWHQAPRGAEDSYRLHLELFSVQRARGKLKYLAGSESGMAVWINDVLPESVAARLREVIQ